MTYKKKIEESCKVALEHNKEESAVLFLIEHASGLSSSELFMKQTSKMSEEEEEKFDRMFDLYIYHNQPVQYLTGHSYFYGYEFNVNSDVLIPRPETEELVENILKIYDRTFKRGTKVDVVDIGTGSGAISVTLSLEEKSMNVSATDISASALKVAKENNSKLNGNVTFYEGDMLQPVIDKKFDILVSNPPYIPDSEYVDPLVKENEPNVALFGGEDGLKFYNIILNDSLKIMKDKFIIGFEHGYNTSKDIEDLARKLYPNAYVFTKKDMQGRDRMTFVIQGFDYEE